MDSNKLNRNQKQFIDNLFICETNTKSGLDSNNGFKDELNSEPSVRPKIRPIGFATINSYIQPSVRPKVRPKAHLFVEPKMEMIGEAEFESSAEECMRSPEMKNSRQRSEGFEKPFRAPKTPHNLKFPQKTRFSFNSFEAIIKDINGNDSIKSTDKTDVNYNSFDNRFDDKDINTNNCKTCLQNKPLLDSLDEIRVKYPTIDSSNRLRRPLGPNVLKNSLLSSMRKPSPALRKPKQLVTDILQKFQ